VVERHSIHLHLYTDDSQIYTSVAVSDIASAVHCLAACTADVNNWMSASRLRFKFQSVQDRDHVTPYAEMFITVLHQLHCCCGILSV